MTFDVRNTAYDLVGFAVYATGDRVTFARMGEPRSASVLMSGQTLKSWPLRFGGFFSVGGK